ncbi:hypothetical protein [Rhizobium sp. L1K21]|uniref:hypothetical protein n=1 Tax=Rhizobium sp. L1K21 TaxID=2954933 RepID=UPI002092A387|nr:hypothetical protein [Rhizobium sp. L1K21]MCO6188093.1 hypothetical protein [Rhizobium sp. L1K21]
MMLIVFNLRSSKTARALDLHPSDFLRMRLISKSGFASSLFGNGWGHIESWPIGSARVITRTTGFCHPLPAIFVPTSFVGFRLSGFLIKSNVRG